MKEREHIQQYLSFFLTTWGLTQSVMRGDVQVYCSMLFSEISGGQVITVRHSWLLILAAFAFMGGLLGLFNNFLAAGFFFLFTATVLILAYLGTRKTLLQFTNRGGLTMTHAIQGNERQECAKFIHQVEIEKLKDREQTSDLSLKRALENQAAGELR
jgi:hypothetical protein